MNDCGGRTSRLRTRARVAVALAGAVVALVGCGSDGSPARVDAEFVESVRADGHTVPHGAVGEATLVTAARKLCRRQTFHTTTQQRRESALTRDELETVTQAFAGDSRRFATLALETYCP